MYFDFDDRYSDVEPVGHAINVRDGVLASVLFHAALLVVMMLAPALLPWQNEEAEPLQVEQPEAERPRFVFVQPKLDLPSQKPPPRAEPSDLDRQARAVERPPAPTNPMPYARGNSSERAESSPEDRARGRGPSPDPAPETPRVEAPPTPSLSPAEAKMAMQKPQPEAPPAGGSLGDALRNLQKYVQSESFDNPAGQSKEFGPAIQFDTKGVEFGPWIRRFVAQVRRNWFVPQAAMTMRGRVVVTFNVHRSGAISDVTVVQPSPISSFNTSAVNALISSSPTEPLPPEYPDDKAFFTVTFFYNETPTGQSQ